MSPARGPGKKVPSLNIFTADMSKSRLAPGLDQATQITHRQLEGKINGLEDDGKEYPPASRATDESTCSTGLGVVNLMVFSGIDRQILQHSSELTITKSLAIEAFPVKSSASSQYATVNKAKVRTSVRKMITKQTFVRNAQMKKMNDTTPIKMRKKPTETQRCVSNLVSKEFDVV